MSSYINFTQALAVACAIYIINFLCIVIDLTLNEHLDYSHLGDEVYGSSNKYYCICLLMHTHIHF